MKGNGTRTSSRSYVVYRNGAYRINGTRVSLDSIVYAFREGESPEDIRSSFPVLTLEQVYGAITFYLANQSKIDKHLENAEAEYENQRRASRARKPELYEKLDRARRQLFPQK